MNVGSNFLNNAYGKFKIVKALEKSKKPWTYNVFKEDDIFIGKFDFKKENNHLGYVTKLEILPNYRGKKTSLIAIYNIRNFILEEAKKKELSVIHFDANNNNQFNVAKLYKKLFPEAYYKVMDCFTRFSVPVKKSDEYKAKQLLEVFYNVQNQLVSDYEANFPTDLFF